MNIAKKITASELFCLLFLAFIILFNNFASITLHGVDSPAYAQMGRELSSRPIWTWAVHTILGEPFIDNPPLLMWINAISIRLFGLGTFAIIFPTTVISFLTVILTYKLGKRLVNEKYGLIAAFVLILSHTFIKQSRDPMIEPILMFCTMSSVYFAILSIYSKGKILFAALSGFCLALAWLAKGPSILIAPVSILMFYCFTSYFKKYNYAEISLASFVKLFSVMIGVFLLVLSAYELWYYSLTKNIFILEYYKKQIYTSLVLGRGVKKSDHFFYIKLLFSWYWPWLPIMLLTPFLVIVKKIKDYYPALFLNLLIVVGYIAGFSLSKHKYTWYTYSYHVSLSLITAIFIAHYVSDDRFKYFKKLCLSMALLILLTSTLYPSLYNSYERPFEKFIVQAHNELGYVYDNKDLADCAAVGDWKGSFVIKYYLGMNIKGCEQYTLSGIKIVNSTELKLEKGEQIVFARSPFYLVSVR